MKKFTIIVVAALFAAGCTSTRELAYLNNLPETGGESYFPMEIPDYRIRSGDVLYIKARGLTPDGMIADFLSTIRGDVGVSVMQSEAGQFMHGYDVNSNGQVLIPVVGSVQVENLTLEDARLELQKRVDMVFNNTVVECKLLSFKFTVLGEVRSPGTFVNYNNHLTILEALGRAGGISDFGRRDRLVVVRPVGGGTTTYTLNLQDKAILASEAYFLLPNDVIIVEPVEKKAFNLNLPTYTFIITTVTSAITTTLLLINYLGR